MYSFSSFSISISFGRKFNVCMSYGHSTSIYTHQKKRIILAASCDHDTERKRKNVFLIRKWISTFLCEHIWTRIGIFMQQLVHWASKLERERERKSKTNICFMSINRLIMKLFFFFIRFYFFDIIWLHVTLSNGWVFWLLRYV